MDKSVNINKILVRVKHLMYFNLLIVFALKIFGLETFDISIENERLLTLFAVIDENIWLRIFINITTGFILSNIIFSSVIDNYKNKFIQMNILLIIYYTILNSLIYYSNLQYIIDFLTFGAYFIPVFIFKKYRVRSFIKVISIDLTFQIISSIFRNLSVVTYETNSKISIIMAMDYILLWVIYFITRKVGENKWELCSVGAWVFSWKKKRNLKNVLQDTKICLQNVVTNLSKIICKKKLKMQTVNLKCYLKFDFIDDLKDYVLPLAIIFGSYFTFAWFSDKMLEAILLYLSYISIVYVFPEQFHADFIPNIKSKMIPIVCTALTSLILCTGLALVLKTEISVFWTILVAFVISLILYLVKKACDYWTICPLYLKLKEKEEQSKILNEENVKRILVKSKTMPKYHDYLIQTFCYKVKDCVWFNLEENRDKLLDEQQFRNEKTKFKKKLIKYGIVL